MGASFRGDFAMSRFILALLAAGLLLGLLAPPAAAVSFTIVQPNETYAGKTYAQWSVAWWQWAPTISEPNSPVTDDTGADCAVGQQGPVWFLAGTTGGTATRSCTIPSDKAILFPVINGECSTLEKVPANQLAACATGQMDAVTKTSASVDGTDIDLGRPGPNARFRFTSDPLVFRITFAPDNGFGVKAGTGKAVADGYWVLVRPLTVGSHTIDFHGKAVFPGFTFEEGVHYNLTVT
jgi:hypothetical protein